MSWEWVSALRADFTNRSWVEIPKHVVTTLELKAGDSVVFFLVAGRTSLCDVVTLAPAIVRPWIDGQVLGLSTLIAFTDPNVIQALATDLRVDELPEPVLHVLGASAGQAGKNNGDFLWWVERQPKFFTIMHERQYQRDHTSPRRS